jgi:hypothetical protein
VEIVAKDARPLRPIVAVDETFAYWARRGSGDAGQIVRAPLAGGAPTILVSGVNAESVAVDADHLYWTERAFVAGKPSVLRLPKAGGAPEPFAASGEAWDLKEAYDIALDDDAVYWTGTSSQCALRKAKRGETIERVACDEESQKIGLAVDASHVYWVELPRDTRIATTLRRANKQANRGGFGEVVASGDTFRPGKHDARTCLAVDAHSAFWLSNHDGTVVRIAKTDGRATTLAADQRDFVSIALGGGFVYWAWAKSGEIGGISRVPIDGGTVETVAREIRPSGIAYRHDGLVITTAGELSRVTACR